MRKSIIFCLFFLTVLAVGLAYSQKMPEDETLLTSPAIAGGVTPLGTYKFGSIDAISLQNGCLTLNIPLLSLDGRGMDFGISLIYNSKIWQVKEPKRGDPFMAPIRITMDCLPHGWQLSIPKMRYEYITTTTYALNTDYTLMENGAAHHFTNEKKLTAAGVLWNLIPLGYSYDGTYMTFNMANTTTTNFVTRRDGTVLYFRGTYGEPERYPLKIEDKNGNFIRFYLRSEDNYTVYPDLLSSIEDTLGRRVRFIYSEDGALSSIEYTDVNGSVQSIQLQHGTTTLNWGGYTNTRNVISNIILPNSKSYDFEYDQTLNLGKGMITAVTLPTGGKLRYTFGEVVFPGDPWAYDAVLKKEEIQGTSSNAWQYQYNNLIPFPSRAQYPLTTSVTDPLGNVIKCTFMSTDSNGNLVEADKKIYEGSETSGRLLREILTSWDIDDDFPGEISSSLRSYHGCVNPRVLTELTELHDGTSPQGYVKSYTYNVNTSPRYCPDGNPVEIGERTYSGTVAAFTLGSSTLLKRTVMEYLHNSNSNYYTFNLLDLLSKETVLDASGNTVSEKQFEYDNFSLSSNTSIHYETPRNGNYRGNLTRTTTKVFNGTNIVKEKYYDLFGNVIKTKDGNGNQTLFSYTSNYYYAYPESMTNAKGQVTANTYSLYSGALLSSTDPNDKKREFSYDLMGRLIESKNPDGGGTTYVYNDTTPFSITASTKLSVNSFLVTCSYYDGLGRLYLTRTTDPEGDASTEIAYDALGRKIQESTPHRAEESTYYTYYLYDALSRTKKTIYPDGNYIESQYSGYNTTNYDQTGRWREFQYDRLGNLISVNESNLNTTSYQYSVTGNLLQVTQGSRGRTFVNDSASRLTSETQPESGTISYTYDSNSNLVGKTDARAVHTAYTYDSLNRVSSISYTDSTPAITYYYDGDNPINVSSLNPKGRLTGIATARIKEAFSYDTSGRIINEVKEIDGQLYAISYTYDLAGNVTSQVYPSGRIVSGEINSAGRITRLRDETRVRDILSNISYTAFGNIRQKAYGNGIVNSTVFNNRLQPARINYGNVFDISYNYYDSNNENNGNVVGITDNLYVSKSTSYVYDELNRMISASSSTWAQSFSYDIYGNMLSKQGTGGAPSASFAYNQKNQISSLSYDASGNLVNDGVYSFVYNAKNLISAVGIYAYAYDSDDHRTIKEMNDTTIQLTYYINNKDGLPVAEYTKSGSDPICWKRDLIYLGQTLVQSAENPSVQVFSLPPSDVVLYYHQDHLGNTRTVTDQIGNIVETHDYYPYGEEISTQSQTQDKYLFTGKLRDTETGLDYFGARYFSAAQGRFTSPDWSEKPQPIPYADLGNPQTLNLYSYVINNPLNRIDPLGHNWFPIDNKWEWHPGKTYTRKDGQGNEQTYNSSYAGFLYAQQTGTDAQGAATYKLTLYNQDKVVGTATAFSGGAGFDPIKDGNYQILTTHDPTRPTDPSPGDPENNPPASYQTQQIDRTLNPYAEAVFQAYGPIRARLNPLSGRDIGGYYFHGQFDGRGWTHGCLCYGTDTRIIDYIWNNMPNTWVGVGVNVPVVKP